MPVLCLELKDPLSHPSAVNAFKLATSKVSYLLKEGNG